MRAIANLTISLILAAGFITTATLSIQNIEPISLKFLTFESIEIPFGVLLSFSVGGGMILGAILPPLLRSSPNKTTSNPSSRSSRRSPRDIPPEDDILENWEG